MKADSRINKKVEGSRYNSICGTRVLGVMPVKVGNERELSVQLKQLHISDTSLCIIPERQKLLSWTSLVS